MDQNQLALFVGGLLMTNIVVVWRVLVFGFDKIHQYLNLLKRVESLETAIDKLQRDLNGVGQKIREQKSS